MKLFIKIIAILLSLNFIFVTVAQASQVKVTQNSNSLGLYEVLELNFHYSGIFRNPWEYADIVVEFIHPKSRDTLTVGGFYYQFDEWKVRFSPAKIGIWSYNYQFSVHGKSIAEGRGRFTANPSGHPGYVRISPENSYRFVYDNGKPYYPLGFGNCNYDNTFGFDGPDRWKLKSTSNPHLPSHTPVSIDTYFNAYCEVGFNIYRWSNNNCGFNIYKKITPMENFYKIRESQLLDELVQKTQKYGFRLVFNPLNTPYLTPAKEVTDTLKVNAVKRYLKYCVDRWGAWVDIWEFFNEEWVDSAWFAILVPYLKKIDPYDHLVTSNPSHMASSLFDLLTKHYYENNDNKKIDRYLMHSLKNYHKPILFTEYGNKRPYSNYHPLRYRVFIWSAFTNQKHLVFWNNSFAKYDTGGTGQYTNIYLGPEARRMTKIHTQFIMNFPTQHRNINLEISEPQKARAHCLQADDDLIVYFYHFADRPNTLSGREKDTGPVLKNMTVQVPVPPDANVVIWLNPKTGSILNSFDVTPGIQSLDVPDFQIDIALRVTRKERIIRILNSSSLIDLNLN